MKNNNKVALMAVVSVLSASPAFSGSWLNECVSYVRDKWSLDTNFNNGKTSDPVCPIPNDFYDPGYNRGTPTQCTGVRIRGGACRTETWGWNCEQGKLNGMERRWTSGRPAPRPPGRTGPASCSTSRAR